MKTDEKFFEKVLELLSLKSQDAPIGETKDGKLKKISGNDKPEDFKRFISPSEIDNEVLNLLFGEPKKRKNKKTGEYTLPKNRVGAADYKLFIQLFGILHQNANPNIAKKVQDEMGWHFGRKTKK